MLHLGRAVPPVTVAPTTEEVPQPTKADIAASSGKQEVEPEPGALTDVKEENADQGGKDANPKKPRKAPPKPLAAEFAACQAVGKQLKTLSEQVATMIALGEIEVTKKEDETPWSWMNTGEIADLKKSQDVVAADLQTFNNKIYFNKAEKLIKEMGLNSAQTYLEHYQRVLGEHHVNMSEVAGPLMSMQVARVSFVSKTAKTPTKRRRKTE